MITTNTNKKPSMWDHKRLYRIGVLFILALLTFPLIDRLDESTTKAKIVGAKEEAFTLAVVYQNQPMLTECSIKWSYVEDEDRWYLFLPYNNSTDTIKWSFRKKAEVFLDDILISSGDTVCAAAGEHILHVKTEDNNTEYALTILYSASLPTMYINTDSESLDYIHADKENRESGNFTLFDENADVHYHSKIKTIKCRGNASFNHTDKKSYKLQLHEKADLLGMGAGENWLLISNAFDETMLRNLITFDMARQLKVPYTPEAKHVNLYINGEYRGLYLLSEKVEIGENRVALQDMEDITEKLNKNKDMSDFPVFNATDNRLAAVKGVEVENEPDDNTGGYLLEVELDFRWEEEPSGFITSRMQPVVVKSPEYATRRQMEYISQFYQDFEDALFSEDGYSDHTGNYYTDYIDMDSFVRRYLIEEIVKNRDTIYTSQFFYKPSNTESTKLHAGPVWDYDGAIAAKGTVADTYELSDPNGLYACDFGDCNIYRGLYMHQDFRQTAIDLFLSEGSSIIEKEINGKIQEMAEQIEDAVIMDAYLWDVFPDAATPEQKKNCYMEEVKKITDFLAERNKYLKWIWENQ